MSLDRWRWKEPEFSAVQVLPGRKWPAVVKPARSACDPSVIAAVTIDGLDEDVRAGDWVRFDELGNAVEVLADEDIRRRAVNLEE